MSLINPMRQALEALDTALFWLKDADLGTTYVAMQKRAEALRQVIGQAEKMEPYAYAVYFPDQPKIELCHELDELCDDMTNREHEVTPLYTHPPAAPAQLYVFDERT